MQTHTHLAALCFLFVGAGMAPGQGFVVHAAETRQSTRMLYTTGVAKPAEVYIHYGSPVWREEHAAEITKRETGRFRLGTGFWATLHTTANLTLGGKTVPANIWYLGLERSGAAEWSLVLFDSAKIARAGLLSGATRDAKPDLRVPMALSKSEKMTHDLSIALVAAKEFGRGRLVVAWGEYRLATEVTVDVKVLRPLDEPKFRKLDPARTVTTATGLQLEEVQPGIGATPTRTDKVEVRYVGWLEDGTRFDSTFTTKQTRTFPVSGVIRGWSDALMRMKPGAVFRVRIPPDQGYGERGTGPIPAGATLVFWMELQAIR